MTGLSFAAALIGAKKPATAKDSVATADLPVATPSSENTVPSAPPASAAPTVRKNAWSVPVAAAPAAEKIVDSKVTCAAPETTGSSKPVAIKPEGTNDEPSVSSASHQSVETVAATATSTAKRREARDEHQNEKGGEKKSKCSKALMIFVFVLMICIVTRVTHIAHTRFLFSIRTYFATFVPPFQIPTGAWKKPDAGSSDEKGKPTPQEEQNEKKSESNAGKHKHKKASANSISHDGKQKKHNGNKPKQQKGGSKSPHQQQQQKGKKGKQNSAFSKGSEKSGNPNANNGTKSKKKSAKSNNNKKKNNKGQKQRKNTYSLPPPLSPAELEQLKLAVVYQVEYFFSDDELCRNTFLRRNMDCEGYVPAAMIFNFPSIAAYCFQYYDLLTILAEKSTFLEIDKINETLRRRDDYKKWLHPNDEGGFGCPRWIKQEHDGKQNGANDETTTKKTTEIVANLAEADDDSSGGSNVTPDTDSCTDSENLEQADPLEQQGEAKATIVA